MCLFNILSMFSVDALDTFSCRVLMKFFTVVDVSFVIRTRVYVIVFYVSIQRSDAILHRYEVVVNEEEFGMYQLFRLM